MKQLLKFRVLQQHNAESSKVLTYHVLYHVQAKRVITYNVKYLGYNEEKKQVDLGGLDGIFSKTVISSYLMQCSVVSGLLDPKTGEWPLEFFCHLV